MSGATGTWATWRPDRSVKLEVPDKAIGLEK